MKVLLDSSTILRDPGRHKVATRALERLLADGLLHLAIPEVVKREVEANLRHQTEQDIATIRAGLSSLKRRLPSTLPRLADGALEGPLTSAIGDLPAAIVTDFEAWLQASKATVETIGPEDGRAVMDAYFAGSPPFKESRNRDDIPDAFIVEAIRRSAVQGPLSAVIADERLATAAAAVQNVTVYRTLDDFVAAPAVQERLRRAFGDRNLALLRTLAAGTDASFGDRLEGQQLDILVGRTLESPKIPGDNNEATVRMVGTMDGFVMDWSAAEYYGADKVVVPCYFSTEVNADSYIFKADWYSMPDDEALSLSISEVNEHYFEAEGSYPIVVSGLVSLALGVDISSHEYSSEELTEALESAEPSFDDILSLQVADH